MARPSVLVIHNQYLEPGGEDVVVRSEIALLRQHGHRVLQYARHNREISGFSAVRRTGLALTTTWDNESYSEVRALIRQEQPDVAHCHNLLPLLSPSVYYACAAEGVPVIQTVHNYRLICPAGNAFRNGAACDGCRRGLTKSMVRGCYRGSRSQTASIALMLGVHHALGTWNCKVNTYIAPSHFCRAKLTRQFLHPPKLEVKPHFIGDLPPTRRGPGEYAVFVGRLSEEKGILPLLKTWRELRDIPLLVVGSGPLEHAAHQLADSSDHRIRFTGLVPHGEALRLIRSACFLVAPSRCYETFGLTVLEAMACGVPAIVPRHGALRELVCDRRTGLVFDIDHPEQLSTAIRWAWSHTLEVREMGRAARHHCLEHYSPDVNYKKLMQIYEAARSAPETTGDSSRLVRDLAAVAAVPPVCSGAAALDQLLP